MKITTENPASHWSLSLSHEKEEIFVRMLATLEDIAEADRSDGFAEWAQRIASNAVKMARGEARGKMLSGEARNQRIDDWESEQEWVDRYTIGGNDADQGVEGADSSTAPVRDAGAGDEGHSRGEVEHDPKT